MNSIFLEKIVAKQKSAFDIFLRVAGVVVVIGCVFGVLVSPYVLIVTFFVGYGVYVLFQYTDVEFEYDLVEDELSIDKIYGKNRRKHCHTFEMKKLEVLAPISHHKLDAYRQRTDLMSLDFSSGTGADTTYGMVIGYGAGMAFLVLEPGEEIIAAIKKMAPGKVTEGIK